MLLILAALAVGGVYTAPEPIRRDRWYGGEAPEGDAAWRYLVGWELSVRPDGSIQGCEISSGSGNPDVDDGTCRILQKRARFHPAKAPNGTSMYGLFRGWTRWSGGLEGDGHSFKIIVDTAPPKTPLPARVGIMFLVDPNGRASACVAENEDTHPTLAALACQRLTIEMKTPPVLTEAGLPIASVQNATVLLVDERKL